MLKISFLQQNKIHVFHAQEEKNKTHSSIIHVVRKGCVCHHVCNTLRFVVFHWLNSNMAAAFTKTIIYAVTDWAFRFTSDYFVNFLLFRSIVIEEAIYTRIIFTFKQNAFIMGHSQILSKPINFPLGFF